MSGDLVSFRLLFVAAKEAGQEHWRPEHDIWRRAAESSPVPIEFSAHDAIAAAVALESDGADFCVMDSALPDADRSHVIGAGNLAPVKPVMVLSAPIGIAKPAGFDLVLPRPASPAHANRLINLCIRTKLPTRALIVDDSAVMRTIVRRTLAASRFAFDICEASDGKTALAQLYKDEIGLIFLDYNMPSLNGFDTMLKIRRDHPNVAVVMMSSTPDGAVADRAHASGVLAFLKKPFYPEDIDAVLDRYYRLFDGAA